MGLRIAEPTLATGSLLQPSNIRPNRMFTADQHIVLYPVGHLKQSKTDAVISSIVEILGQ